MLDEGHFNIPFIFRFNKFRIIILQFQNTIIKIPIFLIASDNTSPIAFSTSLLTNYSYRKSPNIIRKCIRIPSHVWSSVFPTTTDTNFAYVILFILDNTNLYPLVYALASCKCRFAEQAICFRPQKIHPYPTSTHIILSILFDLH